MNRKITVARTPFGRGRRAVDEVEMLQRCQVEIPAIKRFELLGVTAAAKYLNVSRRTMLRWHNQNIITGVINKSNGRREYMYTHLWVFKRLWLDDEKTTT